MKRFKDRVDAGKQLAEKLVKYRNNPDVVVIGLARGGVITAHAIAQALGAPLDALIVRKIGNPWQPEYALGAIAEDGSVMLDEGHMRIFGLTREQIQPIIDEELEELKRRKNVYRGDKELIEINNKIVILVDDGVATGSTLQAALKTVHVANPKKIIVTVPVAPSTLCAQLGREVDECVVLTPLDPWGAISPFYENFPQTTDEQVIELLQSAQ